MAGESNTVAAATRSLLQRRPFITDLMATDAINYRGLARWLQPQVQERLEERDEVRLETIVMAIKRYKNDKSFDDTAMDRIKDVLAESSVRLRSDISYYTFPRTETTHRGVMESYDAITREAGGRCHILHADDEIGFVCQRDHEQYLDEQALEAKRHEDNLALLVLDSPTAILEADGILAYLTREISMNGISIIDMFTTYTETMFLVQEQDSAALYQLLRDRVTTMRS